MQERKLGHPGLEVSAIVLGAAAVAAVLLFLSPPQSGRGRKRTGHA
jgi:aryl-alcohol dehydrogenase-like predicted oxidoreductase